MKTISVTNPQFQQALAAINAGRTVDLLDLIDQYPWLVQHRIGNQEGGYFKDPYLLWFIANNPIRLPQLPPNLIELTHELVRAVKSYAEASYQSQLDDTLALVASGRLVREFGLQLALLDGLLNAGALPRGGAMAALTQGNVEAAGYLVARGDTLTLALAIGLEQISETNTLLAQATTEEKVTALAVAAYYGNESMVQYLLESSVDPNGFPKAESGFHSHATALHQAVSSGCLACVKRLVVAGARLDVLDLVYHQTPLGWATYLAANSTDEPTKQNYSRIKTYLRKAQLKEPN